MSDWVNACPPSGHEPINRWPAVNHLQCWFSRVLCEIEWNQPEAGWLLPQQQPSQPSFKKKDPGNMLSRDFGAVSVWVSRFERYLLLQDPAFFNFSAVGQVEFCLIVSFCFTDHDWCGRKPRRGAKSRVLPPAVGSGGSLSLLLLQGNLFFLDLFYLL